MADLRTLETEQAHPRARALDRIPLRRLLQTINREDQRVPLAVRACLPDVERTVEAVERRLRRGGRLFYIGAGTSGRLGCTDASEMPPTYGVSPRLVQGIIAGGPAALRRSIEGAEDDGPAGRREIRARRIGRNDAVVGLSASGCARFVREALREARRRGAFTACITCNPNAQIIPCARVAMVARTGPEVVAGSTRMKAGTAQKLILNMLSTALMVRLGRVRGGRMVNLQLRCRKLQQRARNLIMDETGASAADAARALAKGGSVQRAIQRLRRMK